MPIRIVQGPGGDKSVFIGLEGFDSNEQQPASGYMNIFAARARICTQDPDAVDIVDDALSASDPAGNSILELQRTHHTELIGVEGETFTSSAGFVTYFNNLVANQIIKVGQFTGVATHSPVSIVAGLGSAFDYTFVADQGCSYHWNETSFPPGLTLSHFDNRRIIGTPTNAGAYRIDVEVRNQCGILSTHLDVNVV